MTVRPQPREIKQLVVQTFLDLGAASRGLFGLKETILANGDRCMARAYRVEDMRAVWSVDDGTVKFYDAEGCLLRIVNLLAERMPQLMAA
jgi:hypothetical protein